MWLAHIRTAEFSSTLSSWREGSVQLTDNSAKIADWTALRRFCGHVAYLGALVDPFRVISEKNENNNDKSVQLSVTGCSGAAYGNL